MPRKKQSCYIKPQPAVQLTFHKRCCLQSVYAVAAVPYRFFFTSLTNFGKHIM